MARRKTPSYRLRLLSSGMLSGALRHGYALIALGCIAGPEVAHAQQAVQQSANSGQLPELSVTGQQATAFAAKPNFQTDTVRLGPMGEQSVLTTPASVTTVPLDLLVNNQVKTVNDALRYLPSVQIRDQQGFEVSRPQSRGFQSSIAQNTRLDGLNIIGTTAIAAESLSGIQVLNGLAGALYGPENPSGVFNYLSKRPTGTPLARFIESYDSNSIFTEQADLGGRVGKVGYRINVVHGEGESYVSGSRANRTLISGAFDYHIDADNVIETTLSHYETRTTGLPGSIVYDSGKSTILPSAVDPTRLGYGQPGAGTDLVTDTAMAKYRHRFNDAWSFEVGGLYQNANRGLFGITNTLTDNLGHYTVTKNFDAIPRFDIVSNSAYLNGHFKLLGMKHDLSFGTNGFVMRQYSANNSLSTVLGTGSLSNPTVLPMVPVPGDGGHYQSGQLSEQSIILGDMIHLDRHWAIQGVLNASFLDSTSWNKKGAVTSSNSADGVISPTVSVIYTPTDRLTLYANWAKSIEQGEQAPASAANANAFLSPYHDEQYEVGIKYAPKEHLLLTLDAFRMTRPFSNAVAPTNVFQVLGQQRNMGVEFFAQGDLTPGLSVLGGVTYIDARLLNTHNAATDGGWVVGVPDVKTDIALDFHPDYLRGAALTGAFHYEGRRAATNTNNSFASSFATLDLGVRYNMPMWRHFATARFQVINVTDTRYYVSVADGNIVGSAGANTAYLGTPRTFMASLEFDY